MRDPTWQSDYGIVAQQSSGSLMLYSIVIYSFPQWLFLVGAGEV
jgi:hypothetical protein